MTDDALKQIQELVSQAQSSLKTANTLLQELTGSADISHDRMIQRAARIAPAGPVSGRIIEGAFNGQNMVDAQGQTYPVPANYASKSKLVEGDGMKLTITDEGKFIYKQILPIERKVTKGVLIQEDGQFKVLCEGRAYRVLLASVTFYRAEVGDQLTVLLPKGEQAEWAAVEAVLPKHIAESAARDVLTAQSVTHDDGEIHPTMSKMDDGLAPGMGDDQDEITEKTPQKAKRKKT